MSKPKRPHEFVPRIAAEADPILLATAMLTLDRACCPTLVDLCETSAHLLGCTAFSSGDELWIRVGVLDRIATVVHIAEGVCEVRFETPLPQADMRHFRAEARNLLIMRVSPEEKAAALEWIAGMAR